MSIVPKSQVITVPDVAQAGLDVVIVARPASPEKSTASVTFVAVPVGLVLVSTLSPAVRSLPMPETPRVVSLPKTLTEIGFESAWAGAAASPPETAVTVVSAATPMRRALSNGVSGKVSPISLECAGRHPKETLPPGPRTRRPVCAETPVVSVSPTNSTAGPSVRARRAADVPGQGCGPGRLGRTANSRPHADERGQTLGVLTW